MSNGFCSFPFKEGAEGPGGCQSVLPLKGQIFIIISVLSQAVVELIVRTRIPYSCRQLSILGRA